MNTYDWKDFLNNASNILQTILGFMGAIAFLHFIIWYWEIPLPDMPFTIGQIYYMTALTIFTGWVVYEIAYFFIRKVYVFFFNKEWQIRRKKSEKFAIQRQAKDILFEIIFGSHRLRSAVKNREIEYMIEDYEKEDDAVTIVADAKTVIEALKWIRKY